MLNPGHVDLNAGSVDVTSRPEPRTCGRDSVLDLAYMDVTPCCDPGRVNRAKVDIRLPGRGNSNAHGARPVHQIISMVKWIRTSRLSIKNSDCVMNPGRVDVMPS